MGIKRGLLIIVIFLFVLSNVNATSDNTVDLNLEGRNFWMWSTPWFIYENSISITERWSNWQQGQFRDARATTSPNFLLSTPQVKVEYTPVTREYDFVWTAAYLCCRRGECSDDADNILHYLRYSGEGGEGAQWQWLCGWYFKSKPLLKLERGRCNPETDRGHTCGLSITPSGRKPAVLHCEGPTGSRWGTWQVSEMDARPLFGRVRASCNNIDDICVVGQYAGAPPGVGEPDPLRRVDHVTAEVFMRMNNIYRSHPTPFSTGYILDTLNGPKYGFQLAGPGGWLFACIPSDTCSSEGDGSCFNFIHLPDSSDPQEARPDVRGWWAGICKAVSSPHSGGDRTHYIYVPDYENNPAGRNGVHPTYYGKCILGGCQQRVGGPANCIP